MAQKVGKGQLSVLLVIVCDRFGLSYALKKRKEDLLENVVVFDLRLDDKSYRSEVKVLL